MKGLTRRKQPYYHYLKQNFASKILNNVGKVRNRGRTSNMLLVNKSSTDIYEQIEEDKWKNSLKGKN